MKEIEKLDEEMKRKLFYQIKFWNEETQMGCDPADRDAFWKAIHERDRQLLELVKGEIAKLRTFPYERREQFEENQIYDKAISVIDNFLKEAE